MSEGCRVARTAERMGTGSEGLELRIRSEGGQWIPWGALLVVCALVAGFENWVKYG